MSAVRWLCVSTLLLPGCGLLLDPDFASPDAAMPTRDASMSDGIVVVDADVDANVDANVDAGPVDCPVDPVAIVPSNVSGLVIDEGTIDLALGPGTYTATLTGEGITIEAEAGEVVTFDASTDITAAYAVVPLHSLQLAAGATLRFKEDRPVVLLVATTANIDGTIPVAATADQPGPGGFAGAFAGVLPPPGMGPGGGGSSETEEAGTDGGGGGGGSGSQGCAGGGGASAGGGGLGYTTPELVPLIGGAGGGAGGLPGGDGGQGGGALQITAGACIRVGGTIDASGSGGLGGRTSNPNSGGGGGGGGAGGAILLEAARVVIAAGACVGANGGAGGQGSPDAFTEGVDGEAGSACMAPVHGPVADLQGGAGGDGSDASGACSAGGVGAPIDMTLPYIEGGGGGGGAGRIRINTLSGTEPFDGVLPAFSSDLATVGSIAVR